jgi:hypothetical protein
MNRNGKHPALEQLYDIIKKEDWSTFCPEKTRKEFLDKWCKAWIVDVEFEQMVVDTKYLTSEYNDAIKYKLAQSIAEDLSENCTEYTVEDKKIGAKVCAFRRREKTRG